ncbi:uncharacterized protein PG986_012991 [Apiospora aurea]|uniref:Uncharacterized protein n=1 Tax=Apiospora aurea TaxID=335848 RepID=A0ABR1Q1K1_9PEZI
MQRRTKSTGANNSAWCSSRGNAISRSVCCRLAVRPVEPRSVLVSSVDPIAAKVALAIPGTREGLTIGGAVRVGAEVAVDAPGRVDGVGVVDVNLAAVRPGEARGRALLEAVLEGGRLGAVGHGHAAGLDDDLLREAVGVVGRHVGEGDGADHRGRGRGGVGVGDGHGRDGLGCGRGGGARRGGDGGQARGRGGGRDSLGAGRDGLGRGRHRRGYGDGLRRGRGGAGEAAARRGDDIVGEAAECCFPELENDGRLTFLMMMG